MLDFRHNRSIFLGSIWVQESVAVERVGGETGVQEYDKNTEKRAKNRDEGNIDKATKSELYGINRNAEKSACTNHNPHDRSSLSHPLSQPQSLYIASPTLASLEQQRQQQQNVYFSG